MKVWYSVYEHLMHHAYRVSYWWNVEYFLAQQYRRVKGRRLLLKYEDLYTFADALSYSPRLQGHYPVDDHATGSFCTRHEVAHLLL